MRRTLRLSFLGEHYEDPRRSSTGPEPLTSGMLVYFGVERILFLLSLIGVPPQAPTVPFGNPATSQVKRPVGFAYTRLATGLPFSWRFLDMPSPTSSINDRKIRSCQGLPD